MEDDFLHMNKEAKELVSQLERLKQEVSAYQNSKDQLMDLTEVISGFVEETKILTERSSKVIENTANLTPTKIDNKVDEISNRVDQLEILINNAVESMQSAESTLTHQVNSSIDKMVESVQRMESSISNQLQLLIQAVEGNSIAIKEKKFTLFRRSK